MIDVNVALNVSSQHYERQCRAECIANVIDANATLNVSSLHDKRQYCAEYIVMIGELGHLCQT